MVTLRQAEAMVGLPFEPGVFDCVHLAVEAQRRLFQRRVRWPRGLRHPRGRMTQGARINAYRNRVADPVERPEHGGLVLMLQPVPNGKWQYHLGTTFLHLGQIWVLHVHEGGSSVLQIEEDLYRDGTRREGYYRWRLDSAEGTP